MKNRKIVNVKVTNEFTRRDALKLAGVGAGAVLLVSCDRNSSLAESISTASPTPKPTSTSTSMADNTPEPTPTPVPYYLENGILYNLDKTTGEYAVVGENVASITTVDGVVTARNAEGTDLYRYDAEAGTWVEVNVERVYTNALDAELIQGVRDFVMEKTGMTVQELVISRQPAINEPINASAYGGEGSNGIYNNYGVYLKSEPISISDLTGHEGDIAMIAYFGENTGYGYVVPRLVAYTNGGQLRKATMIVNGMSSGFDRVETSFETMAVTCPRFMVH